LFLAATHVAHDCVVGDNAIFANNAALGGHVKIGHNVMLGGFASVQQWCRVGDHAMVGSQTAVDADVIPFAIAVGNRASLTGINVIGLERRGFDAIDVDLLRQAFRDLFHRDGLFSERLGRMRDIYEKNPLVGQIISFIDGAGKNGICKTASKVTK
jgi:UDP-N-acetylglucosamine acyltransferase